MIGNIARRIYFALRPMPGAETGKNDISHFLARRFGLSHYFELTAPSTGHFYAQIDRTRFASVQRLVYRAGGWLFGGHMDGRHIDYRVSGPDIAPAMARLRATGPIPDIALVDSYHSYDESLRDLEMMVEMLPEGGFLVVHDCLPKSRDYCTAEWIPGAWCGLSYAAYLDFVLGRDDLDYLTVDCDWGCGVIAKGRRLSLEAADTPERPDAAMKTRWFTRDRDDAGATWDAFEADQAALLRLVSPEDFFAGVDTTPLGKEDRTAEENGAGNGN